MRHVPLLAVLLVAASGAAADDPLPPPPKDRACFQACGAKMQECIMKCPLPPETEDDPAEDMDKPEGKGKTPKAKKPTKSDECAGACIKKNEPCFRGCK